MGNGQSCPNVPNVARVCTSATYSGDRVLLDASYFSDSVDNCSCSFSTTADTIRIVTYTAPNFQLCNSAIRLYSDSGNAMRFECLMSGTYLDTSAYRTGGTEFETLGRDYDMNYCLVLEHLGTPTDSITLSCNGLEDIPMTFTSETTTGVLNIVPESTTMDIPTTYRPIEELGNITELPITESKNSSSAFNEDANMETQSSPILTLNNDSILEKNESLGNETSPYVENKFNITVLESANIEVTNEKVMASVAPPNETRGLNENAYTTFDRTPKDQTTFEPVILETKLNSEPAKSGTGHSDTVSQTTTPKVVPVTIDGSLDRAAVTTTPTIPFTKKGIALGIENMGHGIVREHPRNITSSANSDLDLTTNLQSVNETIGQDVVGSDTFGTDNKPAFENDAIYRKVGSGFKLDTATSGISEMKESARIPYERLNDSSIIKEIMTNSSQSNLDMYNGKDKNISSEVENEIGEFQSEQRDMSSVDNINNVTETDSATTHHPPSPVTFEHKIHSKSEWLNTLQVRPLTTDRLLSVERDLLYPIATSTETPYTHANGLTGKLHNETTNDTSLVSLGGDTVVTPLSNVLPTDGKILIADNASLAEVSPEDLHSFDVNASAALALAKNVEENFKFEPIEASKERIISFRNDSILSENAISPQTSTLKEIIPIGDVTIVPYIITTEPTQTESTEMIIPSGNDFIVTGNITTDPTRLSIGKMPFGNDFIVTGNITTDPTRLSIGKMPFGNDAIITEPTPMSTEKIIPPGNDAIMTEPTPMSTEKIIPPGNDAIMTEPTPMSTEKIIPPGNDAIMTEPTPMSTEKIIPPGNDAIMTEPTPMSTEKIIPPGNDAIMTDQTAMSNEEVPFVLDRVITEGMTTDSTPMLTEKTIPFGSDIIVPDNIATEATSMSTEKRIRLGNDTIVPEGIITKPTPKSIKGKIPFRNDAIVPDGIMTEQTPMSTEKKISFGNDAIVPEGVMTEQTPMSIEKKIQFGNDAILPDGIMLEQTPMSIEKKIQFGNDAILPDGIMLEQTPITIEKKTPFGNDAIVPEGIMTEQIPMSTEKNIPFGNDAIVPDGIMAEQTPITIEKKISFGNDAIVPEGIMTEQIPMSTEKNIPFGNDAIVPDGIMAEQTPMSIEKVIPFGNDAIETGSSMPKSTPMSTDKRIPFGNDGIVTDNIMTEPIPVSTEKVIPFGNDAIETESSTTRPTPMPTGKSIPFRNDGKVTENIMKKSTPMSTEEVILFKNDALVPEGIMTKPTPMSTEKRILFENDAMETDIIMPKSTPMSTGQIPFGNDAIVTDSIMSESTPISTEKRIMFGINAILPHDITIEPTPMSTGKRIPFGNDGVLPGNSTTESTSMSPGKRFTFGNDGIDPESIMTEPTPVSVEKVSFRNDAIVTDIRIRESTPISRDERILFGKDGQVQDNNRLNNTGRVIGFDSVTAFASDVLDRNKIRPQSVNDTSLELTPAPLGNTVLGELLDTRSIIVKGGSNHSHTDAVIGNPQSGHDFIARSTVDPIPNVRPKNTLAFRINDPSMHTDLMDSFLSTLNLLESDLIVPSNATSTNVTIEPDAIDLQAGLKGRDIAETFIRNTTTDTIEGRPITEVLLSKQRESSLLSNVDQVQRDAPSSLLASVLHTHGDTLSAGRDHTLLTSLRNDEVMASADHVTADQSTTNSSLSTTVNMITQDVEITTIHSDLFNEDSKDVLAEKDVPFHQLGTTTLGYTTAVNKAIKVTLPVTTRTTPSLSTTTDTFISSTEPTQTSTTTELGVLESALPDKVPGHHIVHETAVHREEMIPDVSEVQTTRTRVTTTKKPYAVMVNEPIMKDDRNAIDESLETPSDKDRLNVSLEDDTGPTTFDMNNKTYIVIVIAVAGFLVLVAIIIVIIRNKRKSRHDKADVSNGVPNHTNAAYDSEVSEAERGNAPGITNGGDLPKPSVEVIEPPTTNGSDNSISGHL